MGLSSQQVNSAPHGSSVLQRRRSSGAKRAGGRARALGAVRLKETQQVEEPAADAAGPRQELGDGSDTGTLHGKEENADALNSKPGSSEAKRQSPTSRFQDELARDGTTDRWFDEQMSTSQRRSSSGSAGSAPHGSCQLSSAGSRLARQLQSFQEALKQHFGVGRLAEELPPPNAGNPAEGLEHVSPGLTTTGARQQNSRQQVHGASIMDLGLDAINKVGQTINNFADRVDTTIEHWIESFQSLEDLQRFLDSGSPQHQVRADQARQPSGNSSIGSPTRVKPQAATSPTGSRSAQHRPAKSPIGAFLDAKQTLEEEVAYREAEQARLQEECRRLHAELRYAANKCSALSEENSLLRLREVDELSPVPRSTEHHHSAMAGDPDPLTDLMARQLETLLAEKAKLAQENARLARENNTLHDMLTFSMASMEEEDGASDSVIDEPDSWVTVGNSAVAVA